MAIFVPNGEVIDKAADLVNDANRNRVIGMDIINHDNLLNEPQWRTKQMLTYQNLIQTTNPVDLGYLLSQENQQNQQYYQNIALQGMKMLSTITSLINAKVITAALSFDKIQYLMTNFKPIIRDYCSLYGIIK